MEFLPFLNDPTAVIVADTSTVINLNATGYGLEIIRAFPGKLVVADVVLGELEHGQARGRRDAELLKDLMTAGAVKTVQLDDEASLHFEHLVVGPAAMTLDDGEAATIAYAARHSAIAIIDERKATHLCKLMFPELRIGCTVDLLASPEVQHRLGQNKLADAVYNALFYGRMRVFTHHVEWVIGLIGAEKAAECTSLPSSIRRPQQRLIRTRGLGLDRVENE